jgi:hypothetical protein
MITLRRFRRLEEALKRAGYGPTIDWSEKVTAPRDAEAFAREAIYVICNSGMKNSVAAPIAASCLEVLRRGGSATSVFRHPGKGPAIDSIWSKRAELFERFTAGNAKVEDLLELPWIGPVTMYHLAKNLGADEAKPDVHLERIARGDNTTTHRLCRRLARTSGCRVATVDSILWRAAADGYLNSKIYELEGWRAATKVLRASEAQKSTDGQIT